MKYSAVLFDLDGTLTRSEEGITRSALWAAEQLNYTGFTQEQLKAFIGPPLYVSFPKVMGMKEEDVDEAVRLYKERYARIGWLENEVYPGIPRLLRSLKEKGLKALIATAKPQVFAEKIAERFGLLPYLDGIVGPTTERVSVSKADFVRKAAQMAGGKAVMVGDRCFDIDAAKEVGIDSIGVTYGYGSREELYASGADTIADDVRGLQRLILGDLPPARGIFISMEGMDGCGKTTQRTALVRHLETMGWEVTQTREPGGDGIAEKIRQIILDPANTEMFDETEAYLYAASRAQNVRAIIRPAVEDGRLVVCDRFVDSSIAYQGGGRGLGAERIGDLNAMATGGCLPDLTIYLDMAAGKAIERRRSAGVPDRLERQKDSFYERTQRAYDALFSKGDRSVVHVDAAGSIEEVSERMLSGVDEWLSGAAMN